MATVMQMRLSPVTPDSFNAPREEYIQFGPRGVYTLAPTRDQAALTMEKCVQAHIAGMAKNSSFDCLRVKMHLKRGFNYSSSIHHHTAGPDSRIATALLLWHLFGLQNARQDEPRESQGEYSRSLRDSDDCGADAAQLPRT